MFFQTVNDFNPANRITVIEFNQCYNSNIIRNPLEVGACSFKRIFNVNKILMNLINSIE